MKDKLIQLNNIIYWSILLILSFSMIVYGVAKPIQFQDFTDANTLNVSKGHQVMWTFYSYSKTYVIILGLFEIVGGVALLFNRTRLFGCFLLTTILVNIILQDYFYDVLALKAAIYYQILLFIILIYDYKKLKLVMQALFKRSEKKVHYFVIILAVLVALLCKYLETKM